MNRENLREIAAELELTGIVEQLDSLQERDRLPNKDIIIPLVGEFSAGKTSLLNALTSGKKLETAVTPTTATIFELYFSQTTERAEIIYEDGSSQMISDIGSLKNNSLEQAHLVRVWDTSTKVPTSTVLVDTPGLSSHNPKHREALTGYLPQADAVFLVIDSQQGVTRSLLDYLKIAELARRPVYGIITKCDTKSPAEQDQTRKYIQENVKLSFEQIVCVSAKNGEIAELLQLIERIQQRKNTIVEESFLRQAELIRKELLEQVDAFLQSASLSTAELDAEIGETKKAGNAIVEQISRTMQSLKPKVKPLIDKTLADFNERISYNLDIIVQNPSGDINAAVSINIQETSALVFANFKSDMFRELGTLTMNGLIEQFGEEGIDLSQIKESVGQVTINGLSSTVDLNQRGVETVNKVGAAGIKIAVVGAVATTVVSAVASALPILTIGGILSVLVFGKKAVIGVGAITSAAVDIGSMLYSRATVKKLENLTLRQQGIRPEKRGLEGFVGSITERVYAKPQRQKMIQNFIERQLLPEFKHGLEGTTDEIMLHIEAMLRERSQGAIRDLQTNLEQLKQQKTETAEAYQKRILRLKSYKEALQAKRV